MGDLGHYFCDNFFKFQRISQPIKHILNPLHIYCRVCDITKLIIPSMSKKRRKEINKNFSRFYEEFIWNGNGSGVLSKPLTLLTRFETYFLQNS